MPESTNVQTILVTNNTSPKINNDNPKVVTKYTTEKIKEKWPMLNQLVPHLQTLAVWKISQIVENQQNNAEIEQNLTFFETLNKKWCNSPVETVEKNQNQPAFYFKKISSSELNELIEILKAKIESDFEQTQNQTLAQAEIVVYETKLNHKTKKSEAIEIKRIKIKNPYFQMCQPTSLQDEAKKATNEALNANLKTLSNDEHDKSFSTSQINYSPTQSGAELSIEPLSTSGNDTLKNRQANYSPSNCDNEENNASYLFHKIS